MPQLPNGDSAHAPAHWPPITRRRLPGERLDVWHARPRVCLQFQLRSGLQAAMTHWTGEATSPCVGPGCTWCADQRPRWKGYLGAYALQDYRLPTGALWRKGRCVVEITSAARMDCPRLGLAGDALAGRTLRVWREGDRLKSQVRCALIDQYTDGLADRRPVDPRQVLRRLWCVGEPRIAVADLDLLFLNWNLIEFQE